MNIVIKRKIPSEVFHGFDSGVLKSLKKAWFVLLLSVITAITVPDEDLIISRIWHTWSYKNVAFNFDTGIIFTKKRGPPFRHLRRFNVHFVDMYYTFALLFIKVWKYIRNKILVIKLINFWRLTYVEFEHLAISNIWQEHS